MSKPKAKACSQCGRMIEPQIMSRTVDQNFNSVPHYMTSHQCPAVLKRLDEEEKQIKSDDSLNANQKYNKLRSLDYQNTMAS